jgi:hypothetical protein
MSLGTYTISDSVFYSILTQHAIRKSFFLSLHRAFWYSHGSFTNRCTFIGTLNKCVPVTGPVVAQRVGRVIALLFHDHGTRKGWGVSSTPRPYFTPGKDPVPIVQEAGWALGPVWTGGNLAPLGFDPRTVQPVVSHYTDWATRPIKLWLQFTLKLDGSYVFRSTTIIGGSCNWAWLKLYRY